MYATGNMGDILEIRAHALDTSKQECYAPSLNLSNKIWSTKGDLPRYRRMVETAL